MKMNSLKIELAREQSEHKSAISELQSSIEFVHVYLNNIKAELSAIHPETGGVTKWLKFLSYLENQTRQSEGITKTPAETWVDTQEKVETFIQTAEHLYTWN